MDETVDVSGVFATGEIGFAEASIPIDVEVAGVMAEGFMGQAMGTVADIAEVTGVFAVITLKGTLVWGQLNDTQSANWQNIVH